MAHTSGWDRAISDHMDAMSTISGIYVTNHDGHHCHAVDINGVRTIIGKPLGKVGDRIRS